MRKHHKAWLKAHPNRSEAWLKTHLKDGFHIHHVDGDHENNSSDNLLLIEGTDHLGLHQGPARHVYRHDPKRFYLIPKGKKGVFIIE